jgi:hypothetical protein
VAFVSVRSHNNTKGGQELVGPSSRMSERDEVPRGTRSGPAASFRRLVVGQVVGDKE